MRERLLNFLHALWSLWREGDAPLETASERLAICAVCPRLAETPTGLFCLSCGCPESPISDLRTKTRIPSYQCPDGRW